MYLSKSVRSDIIGVTIAIVITLTFTFGVWNKVLDEPGIESSCIDVNGATSISFDSCYDLESETIFLNVRRNLYEDFNIDSLKVTFFDGSEKEHELIDLPQKGEFKVFYITSEKNPRNVYVQVLVNDELEKPVCKVPRRLFVKDCNLEKQGNQNQNPTTDLSGFQQIDLRSHLVELERKEKAWETKCSSVWQCSEWEECLGGIERRICEDLSDCFIPTNVPTTAQYCTGSCVEDWQCSWSGCIDGKTTPTCVDKNSCGTEFNKPSPVSCSFDSNCEPEIYCSDWTDCSIEYSLMDVNSQDISNLPGAKERVCVDKNSCTGSIRERKDCSTGIDIYTRKFNKCGTEYVDVYDSLDEKLLARISAGNEKDPYVNIRFEGDVNERYCDYCYNGVLDGDETKIDCGGSCKSCVGSRGPISLGSTTIFAKIGRWFSSFF